MEYFKAASAPAKRPPAAPLLILFPLEPSSSHGAASPPAPCPGAHGPYWPPNTPWLDLQLSCNFPTWPSCPKASSDSTTCLPDAIPPPVDYLTRDAASNPLHPQQAASEIELPCNRLDANIISSLDIKEGPGREWQVADWERPVTFAGASLPETDINGTKKINEVLKTKNLFRDSAPLPHRSKLKRKHPAVNTAEPRLDSKGRHILFKKTLFESDIKERQNRLMIGKCHTALVFAQWGKPAAKCNIPIRLVDDDDNEVFDLLFGHWGSSEAYVIKGGWCRYGKKKMLKENDVVIISVDENGTCYIMHEPQQKREHNLQLPPVANGNSDVIPVASDLHSQPLLQLYTGCEGTLSSTTAKNDDAGSPPTPLTDDRHE